jgi:hypothetical protein
MLNNAPFPEPLLEHLLVKSAAPNRVGVGDAPGEGGALSSVIES